MNSQQQQQGTDQQNQEERTEKPPVEDKHKEQAEKMAESYEDDRPTVALPGTGGTISGTAVCRLGR